MLRIWHSVKVFLLNDGEDFMNKLLSIISIQPLLFRPSLLRWLPYLATEHVGTEKAFECTSAISTSFVEALYEKVQ